MRSISLASGFAFRCWRSQTRSTRRGLLPPFGLYRTSPFPGNASGFGSPLLRPPQTAPPSPRTSHFSSTGTLQPVAFGDRSTIQPYHSLITSGRSRQEESGLGSPRRRRRPCGCCAKPTCTSRRPTLDPRAGGAALPNSSCALPPDQRVRGDPQLVADPCDHGDGQVTAAVEHLGHGSGSR